MSTNLLKNNGGKDTLLKRIPQFLKTMAVLSQVTFAHPEVQKIRREGKFDLVVIGWAFNDYHIGLSLDFNCPAVFVSPIPMVKSLQNFVGNPTGVAFTPLLLTDFSSPMSFKDRLQNFVLTFVTAAGTLAMDYFVNEPEYNRNFPPDSYPPYEVAKKNLALVLASTHFSQTGPNANFPSIIEVGGMHIKANADPLPEVIQIK